MSDRTADLRKAVSAAALALEESRRRTQAVLEIALAIIDESKAPRRRAMTPAELEGRARVHNGSVLLDVGEES